MRRSPKARGPLTPGYNRTWRPSKGNLCRERLHHQSEWSAIVYSRSKTQATEEAGNPAQRKSDRLMKGKCFRCGEGHLTDQCSQKGNTLKCSSCNRKGHLAKALFNHADAEPTQFQLNHQSTPHWHMSPPPIFLTRMVCAEISTNAVTSTQYNLPMVQPHSQVHVNGRTVDLDDPPKPIPAMWMWL